MTATNPRTLQPGRAAAVALAASLACATPALADSPAALSAPGLGEEVYGATVEAHEVELESRYGMLTGGSANGQEMRESRPDMASPAIWPWQSWANSNATPTTA